MTFTELSGRPAWTTIEHQAKSHDPNPEKQPLIAEFSQFARYRPFSSALAIRVIGATGRIGKVVLEFGPVPHAVPFSENLAVDSKQLLRFLKQTDSISDEFPLRDLPGFMISLTIPFRKVQPFCFVVAMLCSSVCQADLIKLQDGGEMRARSVEQTDENSVRVKTTTGAILEFAAETVKFVAPRSERVEEYEVKARLNPQTIESCWELAQWCREEGLVDQRNEQLELLLKLDPDHKRARQLLGYIEYEGEWTTREALMSSRGYIKHKGKYVTPEELELMQRSRKERQTISQWYPKVRVAVNQLRSNQQQPTVAALEQFKAIDDDLAVPALIRYMQKDTNRQIRELYVNTLGRLSGPRTVSALVDQALYDIDAGLRALSIRLISPGDQSHALALLVKALKSPENQVVRHAAAALGLIGDHQAIPYLIDALVTTHRYKVQQSVPSTSVTSNGGNPQFGGASGLSAVDAARMTGQYSPYGYTVRDQLPRLTQTVTVKRDQQNWECLQALEAMTSQNFGYDERSWKLWYLAEAKQWK